MDMRWFIAGYEERLLSSFFFFFFKILGPIHQKVAFNQFWKKGLSTATENFWCSRENFPDIEIKGKT